MTLFDSPIQQELATLESTCTVWRPPPWAHPHDDHDVRDWPETGSYPCSFHREVVPGGGHTLLLPASADVQTRDLLETRGRRYSIAAAPPAHTMALRRVHLVQVGPRGALQATGRRP